MKKGIFELYMKRPNKCSKERGGEEMMSYLTATAFAKTVSYGGNLVYLRDLV